MRGRLPWHGSIQDKKMKQELSTITKTKPKTGMTQDEKWQKRYEEVKGFVLANKRNPSKHRIEEHDMLNWVKANRKHLNAGTLKVERMEAFRKLLEMMERYRRKNQYE